MSLRRTTAALVFALAGVGGGVQAQSVASGDVAVTVSTEAAREMARTALSIGRPDLAAQIATQIIAANANDAGAHMVLAAAQSRTGDPQRARKTARLAFRLADTRAQHFEAAYLTAEALVQSGQPSFAKLWLRRADLYAQSDVQSAILAKAYRSVAAQSPFALTLALSAGPSNNVNGGSLHDSFTFSGISIPITQALSGQTAGGSARLSYRLSSGAKFAQDLTFSMSHRSVWLSDAAKKLDPAARREDYTFNEIGLGHMARWSVADGKAIVRTGITVGRRWQGGRLLGDVQRLELGAIRQFGPQYTAGLDLAVEAAQYPARPVANAVQWTLTASLGQTTTPAGQFAYRVGYRSVGSDAAGVVYRGAQIGADWHPPDWIGGLGLKISAGLEQRDYWKTSGFSPDLKMRASVTAELKTLTTMGIVPTIEVAASRSKSDLVVRDTKDFGISFGFSSSF